jgi:hypothetical protein
VLQFGLTEPQSNKEQSVEQPWVGMPLKNFIDLLIAVAKP